MHPHGTCDTGDDAGSHATARTHAAPGRPGRGRLRSRPARAATVLLAAVAALLALPLQAQAQTAGICGRTTAVAIAILSQISGVSSCTNVTDAHLAAITGPLNLNSEGIPVLAAGDFDGLTALTNLNLHTNSLSTLPAGVFDGLTALTYLDLHGNSLSTLPAGVFDELTALTTLSLSRNSLTELPDEVFDELTALTGLWLGGNSLSTLPAGVFDELTALTYLALDFNSLSTLAAGVFDELTALDLLLLRENSLTELPAGVFDELTALTDLRLNDNSLSTLPAGVFDELTALTNLRLDGNLGAPFSSTADAQPDAGTVLPAGGDVTLDGSGSGGPWGTNVTYNWALTSPTSGVTVTFDDAASATPVVTIPALAEGTELTFTLTVTGRSTNASWGSAPDTDTATVVAFDSTAGICGRTEEVRDAIVALVSGVTACADVTDAHLAAITSLDLSNDGITALAAGDFDGLTALTQLYLNRNSLETLPAGVFEELTALTNLQLFNNSLSTLPAGVFDELTVLTNLRLQNNSLSTLPAGVFDELTALTNLRLQGNSLETLPAGVFDELTALTNLRLHDNSLSTLPAGVFEELTALTTLRLQDNPGAPFSPTADALPDDGTVVDAGGDVTLDGSGSDGGPWGTNVTYSWAASGTTVTFDDAASATPVVTIPALADGTELTFTLTVTGRATDASDGSAPATDTATVTAEFDATAGICGRTEQVRTAILALISGVTHCALVTDAHLAAITGTLNLSTKGITALAAGDFDGLTALTGLSMEHNSLSTLPAGVFDELTALTNLILVNNSLSTLPAGVFDGLTSLTWLQLHTNSLSTLPAGVFDDLTALTRLWLTGNSLETLPAGVFDELTALTELWLANNSLSTLPAGVFDELTALTTLILNDNSLTTLPAGVFEELTALTTLRLNGNSLETLPAGVFDGLTALTTLYLQDNDLTTLPAGVFDELTALTTLYLQDNTGAPFSPTADALPDDGTVVDAGGDVTLDGSGSDGGPWGTNVTYSWAASGAAVTFDDAASATPVVTIPALADGTELTFTLTVTGRATNTSHGSAPATDTATVTAEFDSTAGICGRTEVVRDRIVNKISGVTHCALVTDVHLAAITGILAASPAGITALAAGDFDGLTALTQLWLHSNSLSTFPAGVFDELTALTRLILHNNDLTELPAGVFNELTALTTLELNNNDLTTLDDDVFEPLTALTDLRLHGNPGAPFAPTADALPDDGTVPVAGGDVTLDGSGSDGGPWGTNVTYSWAATGAAVTFDDAASATPVVTIPALADDTELTFTLTVTGRATNTSRGSAPDTDTATVTAVGVPELSFAPHTVTVNEDAVSATLTVELDPASTGTVTVDYATRDGAGAAKAGEDYTATSGTLTFAATETSKTITVPILNDDVYEKNESFSVDLTNPTGATLAASGATVRIDSEDAVPTASMADVTVDEGAGTMTLTLRLSHPSDAEIVYFTIYDEDDETGTATEGDDYDDFLLGPGRTATITVPAGDLSQTFDITIVDDSVDEPDETIEIGWQKSVSAEVIPINFTFTGTFTDNDTAGVTVSKTALTVTEADTTGDSYTVVLDSQPTANVVVTVAGHAGTEVLPAPTTLTFTSTTWNTPQPVTVTAADDTDTANDEVSLTHSAASTDSDYDAIVIGGVTVTVEDNDTANSAPTFTSAATFDAAENQTAVGTVQASDSDADDSVTGYAIQGGADRSTFSIVETTGVLTFASAPNFEAPADADTDNAYVVVVRAASGTGARAKTADQTITVTVTDVAGEAPGVPAAPLVSAASVTSVTAAWTAPANAGPPITDYDYRYRVTSPQGAWTEVTTTAITALSATITGLVEDTGYDVQVRATTDEGTSGWSLSGSGSTDANAAPTFTSAATFDAAENQTAVGTVVASDGDTDDSVTGYAIQGGADRSTFSIVETTGVLTFASAPNFEAPADADTDNGYVVVVRATSGTGARAKTADQTITVTVTDVAGEAPGVPAAPLVSAASVTSVTAAWTAPANAGPPITDYDYRYRVTAPQGAWTEVTTTPITALSATITGLAEDTGYDVQVRATTDEGTSGWSASGSGSTDANAAPTFTSAATFDAAENQTAVGTVVASDGDTDDSVTGYAIQGGADRSTFSIVETTGVLTFASAPNFEAPADADTDNAYVVVVRATSGTGARAKTADQTITVTVTDVAGEAPGVPAAPMVSAASVTSVTAAWTAPANAGPPITDYDYRYRVTAPQGAWTEVTTTPITALSATITGLVEDTGYDVQVRATTDEGTSGWSLSGSGSTDANAAPTFTSAATFDAAENQTAVGTVVASDGDADDSVTGYAIQGGADRSTFSIVETTGVLTFASAPNFEAPADADTDNAYVVVVRAASGTGARAKTADQTITVTVTDVAGEAPGVPAAPLVSAASVTSVTAAWTVPANAGPPITDYDYRYRVTAPQGAWTEVTTTPITALSATITGLVEDTGYDVQVRATTAEGTSGWSLSGSGSTDANAAPAFTSAATFDAAENQTAVGTVVASDGDADDSVTGYAIQGGADRSTFSIVETTGVLTFASAPNFEAPADADADNAYVVVVRAASGTGARAKTADQTITVTVTDVAGEAPGVPAAPLVTAASVTSVTAAWTVPANAGPPITDYDYRYRVTAPQGSWTEVTTTAITGLSATITGLVEDTGYDVQVRATTDEGTSGWSLSGSGSTDANAAPTFTSAATFDAAENQTAVGTVVASDSDTDDSVTGYAIQGGADRSTFSIVETTGVLTFASAPNFEAPADADADNAYVVVVRAASGTGARAKTADQTITVTVTDVAGEAPGVPAAPLVTAASVTSVTAAWTAPANAGPPITDYDYRYRVTAPQGPWTEVTTTAITGLSATITGLVEDTGYDVQVRATTDEGTSGWSLSGSGSTDANAAPTFTSAATFDAAENQTAVGTVVASDSDTDDSVTGYAIQGGADRSTFSIVETTGVLTFASAPNFEAPADADADNAYVVVVRATSGTGARAKTADQTITVTVTDVAVEAPMVTAASVTSVTATWTAPAGPPITDYDYRYRVTAPQGPWTEVTNTAITGLSVTITGLAENTEYDVQVRATTDEGTSGWSASGSGSTDANTGQPTISGVAQVGSLLTAGKGTIADVNGTTKADNGDSGYAYTYQWIRVDGGTETNISGATSSTYTPVDDDEGKKIKVRVSFQDDADHSESRTSAATATVTGTDTGPAISIADASATENAGHLLFEVTLSRSFQNTVKVDFETVSGGTATEGVDYHARRTYTHVIPAGETTVQMGFALIEDTVDDAGETVKVRLSNARSGQCVRRQNKGPRHHDRRGNGNDHRAADHHDHRAGSDHSDPRRDRGRGQRVARFQSQALAEA